MVKTSVIIKIGGSIEESKNFHKLCNYIRSLSKRHIVIIIPGGWRFADCVRYLDDKYRLSNKTSHKMAVISMNQYGIFLSDLIKLPVTDDINKLSEKSVIFLPSKYILSDDSLKNSWDVTSDSITAYIAGKIGIKKIILVKDVDGIYTSDPKKNKDAKIIKVISATDMIKFKKETCVDKFFPHIVLKKRIKSYIVNGNYPERISKIIENKNTVCTYLKPE